MSSWSQRSNARFQTRSPERASGGLHPKRAVLEFYPTPIAGVRALLAVETFDGTI